MCSVSFLKKNLKAIFEREVEAGVLSEKKKKKHLALKHTCENYSLAKKEVRLDFQKLIKTTNFRRKIVH
jgi:hypothetical protein